MDSKKLKEKLGYRKLGDTLGILLITFSMELISFCVTTILSFHHPRTDRIDPFMSIIPTISFKIFVSGILIFTNYHLMMQCEVAGLINSTTYPSIWITLSSTCFVSNLLFYTILFLSKFYIITLYQPTLYLFITLFNMIINIFNWSLTIYTNMKLWPLILPDEEETFNDEFNTYYRIAFDLSKSSLIPNVIDLPSGGRRQRFGNTTRKTNF